MAYSRRLLASTMIVLAAILGLNIAPVATSAIPVAQATSVAQSWVNPVPTAVYGDAYGISRPNGKTHWGIDLLADYGDPIYAPAHGEVIYAQAMDGYGYLIQLRFGNQWVFSVGHVPVSSVDALSVGQFIPRGEQFAIVGATGDATCPHAHIELADEHGNRVDPGMLLDGTIGPDMEYAPDPVLPPDPLRALLDTVGIRLP